MTNDADWVADVKRWYFSNQQQRAASASPALGDTAEIGYEAAHPAHPALQARHRPDAARAVFTDRK